MRGYGLEESDQKGRIKRIMTNDINVCIISGRLTRDPELKVTASGTKLCNFSLAVNQTYSKDKQITEFVDFVAFGNTADAITQYARKGAELIITDGKVKSNTHKGKDGRTFKNVYVQVEKFQFGARATQNSSGGATYNAADEPPADASWDSISNVPEDELPF